MAKLGNQNSKKSESIIKKTRLKLEEKILDLYQANLETIKKKGTTFTTNYIYLLGNPGTKKKKKRRNLKSVRGKRGGDLVSTWLKLEKFLISGS